MNEFIIEIKGTQGIDEQSDCIELSTIGTLSEKDGKFLITYEESKTLENKAVKTKVLTEDGKVIMLRSGGIDSRMVIEKGKRNTCFYAIPQGELVLGVFGESIENNLSSNGGRLSMSYTIDIENSLVSQNKVEISVRKV